MPKKAMSDRLILRRALYDALDWQQSLLECYADKTDPAALQAQTHITNYRRVLQKRYGATQTPGERLLEGAVSVSVNICTSCECVCVPDNIE